MGDYSDDAFWRDLDNAFDDYDNGDYDALNTNIKYSCENDYRYPIETNFNYSKINISELIIGDDWLIRKLTNDKSRRMNKVVNIINITDKAILFEFSEEWENVYNWNMKGLRFWLPKSVIYKQKNEKKVIYVPKWVKIKIINHVTK